MMWTKAHPVKQNFSQSAIIGGKELQQAKQRAMMPFLGFILRCCEDIVCYSLLNTSRVSPCTVAKVQYDQNLLT